MARSRNASSKARSAHPPRDATRFLITFIAVLAFAFQSYVTQTHIHGAPETGFASAKIAGTGANKQNPDKFPANDDPANCPICQEILHTGQFVTPSAVSLLLPSLAVSIITIVVDIGVVAQTASHGWQSRAPPAA